MLLVDGITTLTNVRHVTDILDLFHIIENDSLEMFKGDEILSIIWTYKVCSKSIQTDHST